MRSPDRIHRDLLDSMHTLSTKTSIEPERSANNEASRKPSPNLASVHDAVVLMSIYYAQCIEKQGGVKIMHNSNPQKLGKAIPRRNRGSR